VVEIVRGNPSWVVIPKATVFSISKKSKSKETAMYGTMKYFFMLLLCCSYSVLSQTVSTDSNEDRNLDVGMSILYYNPNLSDLNTAYARMEDNFALSRWSDFDVKYLVVPTVVYHLNRKAQISLQLGGSFIERKREEIKSYYLLWTVGGEYRYIPRYWPKYSTSVYVAGGAGFVSAKFHRSYADDVQVNEFMGNFYINAGGGASINVIGRMSVNVDLRYLFIPDKQLSNLNSTLKLKSLTAGIGVFYSL
jgi:hypothetical protein